VKVKRRSYLGDVLTSQWPNERTPRLAENAHGIPCDLVILTADPYREARWSQFVDNLIGYS
jgi:hypothetical protein